MKKILSFVFTMIINIGKFILKIFSFLTKIFGSLFPNLIKMFGWLFSIIPSFFSNIFSGVTNLFTGWQTNMIKIITIVLAFIFSAGMIIGLIKMHDNTISQLALAKSTAASEKIIIDEQQKMQQKLDQLNSYQTQLQKSLDESKLANAIRDQNFENYIKSPSTLKSNKKASNIFKNTLQKLQE